MPRYDLEPDQVSPVYLHNVLLLPFVSQGLRLANYVPDGWHTPRLFPPEGSPRFTVSEYLHITRVSCSNQLIKRRPRIRAFEISSFPANP